MEITLIKTLSGSFKPAYDSDYDKAKKIALNEPFVFTYKKPRNYLFHKKFFGLLNMVFENQEQYSNLDHLRHDLIIEAGFYEIRYGLHGEELKEAKSISFSSMDEVDFSELYNRVIDVIVKYFKFEKEDVLENIEKYF